MYGADLETVNPNAIGEIMKVLCIRTAMIGGGTSYDVYVPKNQKSFHPIAFGCYATTMVRNGKEYFSLADILRTRDGDALPVGDERSAYFKRIRAIAKRLEARFASRVFPELRGHKKLPFLWAQWSMPSAEKAINVKMSAG